MKKNPKPGLATQVFWFWTNFYEEKPETWDGYAGFWVLELFYKEKTRNLGWLGRLLGFGQVSIEKNPEPELARQVFRFCTRFYQDKPETWS